MLVLARLRDETIVIGDNIEVTVVDIRGDKVRLGVNAPKSVSVHRKEIYDAIRRENRDAANVQPKDVGDLSKGQRVVSPLRIAGSEAVDRAAHAPYLRAAIEEARKGLAEGGLPIGSVLVRGNQIIGRGHNQRVQKGDPMAHAEIVALTDAGRQSTYRDTVLYSTLMPCYLCSGASIQFGVPRVVVGESVNFAGAPDLMRSRGIEVIDLHDDECIAMMKEFVKKNPALWNEDIGK